eukprot:3608674-Prymnesium_polylepis.1
MVNGERLVARAAPRCEEHTPRLITCHKLAVSTPHRLEVRPPGPALVPKNVPEFTRKHDHANEILQIALTDSTVPVVCGLTRDGDTWRSTLLVSVRPREAGGQNAEARRRSAASCRLRLVGVLRRPGAARP